MKISSITEDCNSCQMISDIGKNTKTICQVAILDFSKQNILIVHENSLPIERRRWGLPKGKLKIGENFKECGHREVYEETGIDFNLYETEYLKTDRNQIVVIDKPAENIELCIGYEILEAKWVDLDWLKEDVTKDLEYSENHKYNARIRAFIKNILI